MEVRTPTEVGPSARPGRRVRLGMERRSEPKKLPWGPVGHGHAQAIRERGSSASLCPVGIDRARNQPSATSVLWPPRLIHDQVGAEGRYTRQQFLTRELRDACNPWCGIPTNGNCGLDDLSPRGRREIPAQFGGDAPTRPGFRSAGPLRIRTSCGAVTKQDRDIDRVARVQHAVDGGYWRNHRPMVSNSGGRDRQVSCFEQELCSLGSITQMRERKPRPGDGGVSEP